MTRAIPRRLAQDSGASLVLVLALLLLVGLVVTATMSYATTSITASADVAAGVETSFDVDGALQAGINQLRTSDITGRAGPGGGTPACPSLVVPGPGPGRDVAITCEVLQGSGALRGAIERGLPQAVLATAIGAPSGEAGIAALSGSDLLVAGDVAANSTITTKGRALVASGSVAAVEGCSGEVRGASRECGASATPVPSPRQPRSGFVPRAVPACPGSGRTVTFQPGYYDDAQALTRLMRSCATSTFWFPGARGGAVYYFDFHNGEPGHPGGSRTWRIDDRRVRVVGGGSTAPGRPSDVIIPGSCTSPEVAQDNDGVTFVFGGDSRLEVSAGQVELCGPGDAASTAPPVAIFGADHELGDGGPGQSGPETAPIGRSDASPGMLRMQAGSAADVTGTGPIATFGRSATEKDRIVAWDSRAARATIDGASVPGGQQGIVRVGGFRPEDASPQATIPPGATLAFAKLYVRHREARIGSGKDPVAFIQVQVTPDRPGAPQVGPIAPDTGFTPGVGVNADNRRHRYRVDTVDLMATTTLRDEVAEHGFAGATVQWLVRSKDGLDLTADLDTIQLAIGWTSPRQLRTQGSLVGGANCVSQPDRAHPGRGACALVRTSRADGLTRFHVQGAVYAPLAAFDLRHGEVAAPVVTSGLVARQITTGMTRRARPAYDGPMLSTPAPLTVLVRAHTCPEGSCPEPGETPKLTPPWQPAGSSKVIVADPGTRIEPGSREVAVLTWSTRPPGTA